MGVGTYRAKNTIIASGARPRVIPGIEPDGKLIWNYFEAMVPEKIPRSLIVIGSGAIGIEFASFYHTMGANVTVIEILPEIGFVIAMNCETTETELGMRACLIIMEG
jgi:dihydrolipoyl dehydrogenase